MTKIRYCWGSTQFKIQFRIRFFNDLMITPEQCFQYWKMGDGRGLDVEKKKVDEFSEQLIAHCTSCTESGNFRKSKSLI